MRPRPTAPRLGLGVLAGAALVAFSAAPAWAHIDPEPAEVSAGEEATVGFLVEHGCDGSPTTRLDIRLPDALFDGGEPKDEIAFVAKEGWTGRVDADSDDGPVMAITGGPLDSETEETFSIRFTPPAETAGSDLLFPIIQTCESGSIDWISESHDDEHPAPVLAVTEGTGTPSTEPEATTTTATDPDEGQADDTTTTVVSTSVADPTEGDESVGSEGSGAEDDGDDSNEWLLPVILVAVVVIGGGAALAVRARNKGLDGTEVEGPGDTPPSDG